MPDCFAEGAAGIDDAHCPWLAGSRGKTTSYFVLDFNNQIAVLGMIQRPDQATFFTVGFLEATASVQSQLLDPAYRFVIFIRLMRLA
jgi:hypothetical protein